MNETKQPARRRLPALLRNVVLAGAIAGSLSACVPLIIGGVVGAGLLVTDRRTTVKVGIVMEMNPGKKDNITDNKLNPLAETKILDTTLQILRTVKIDELDAAKQDELKQKIKVDVNKALGEGSVYDVYITSFVLQ